MFHLAQKHDLAFHPDAMRVLTRSLHLIDTKLRDDEEANRLFLEILTSKNDPETVLRRMNEAGVLGRFVRHSASVVAMMQFNMYHHYTVDEHLLRCIGVLAEIERGANPEICARQRPDAQIQPRHRDVLYIAMFLHDIAKGRVEDHSIAGARIARHLCPRLGFFAGRNRDRRLAGGKSPRHVDGRAIARPVRPQDHRKLRRGRAVARAASNCSPSSPPPISARSAPAYGTAGRRNFCARSTMRPNRCSPAASPRSTAHSASPSRKLNSARRFRTGRRIELEAHIASLYPAYWLKVDLPHKLQHAKFVRAAQDDGKNLATVVAFDSERAVTELTVLAPDHPWLLSIIAGACAMAGANIVDAQIYTTTDGMALDTISLSREFDRDEDEQRRANRVAEVDREGAARRIAVTGYGRPDAQRRRVVSRRSRLNRRSLSTINGPTATPWWKSQASTAPACSTR